MKGWIRKTWMGCAVAVALGVSAVHASTSGTITFVGRIVEPTCNVADTEVASPGRGLHRCTVGAGQVLPPASSYRQDVAMLESVAADDRLLAYFSGYATADSTRIVTRTYE